MANVQSKGFMYGVEHHLAGELRDHQVGRQRQLADVGTRASTPSFKNSYRYLASLHLGTL